MAAQATRSFTVYAFYVDRLKVPDGHSVAAEIKALLADPLRIANGQSTVICDNGDGHAFELRDVRMNGDLVRGCLSRIREDRPQVREASGHASVLRLAPGSNLLEHNHFLYRCRDRLLLWQFNLRANFHTNFGQMLGRLTGNQLTYAVTPVLGGPVDSFDGQVDAVDFTVSAPRNGMERAALEAVDPSCWDMLNPFSTIAQTSATRMSSKISTRRATGLSQAPLIAFISGLRQTPSTRRLRVELAGIDEPIDLLADRFKYKAQVALDDNRNFWVPGIDQALSDALQHFDQSPANP